MCGDGVCFLFLLMDDAMVRLFFSGRGDGILDPTANISTVQPRGRMNDWPGPGVETNFGAGDGVEWALQLAPLSLPGFGGPASCRPPPPSGPSQPSWFGGRQFS